MKLSNIQHELLSDGSYAKKQILSKSWIISWSHSARFSMGYNLVQKYGKGNILDYGCGDATFLIYLKDLIKDKVGVDIDEQHLAGCRRRFDKYHDYRFIHVDDLLQEDKKYDLVTCTEVMEHCPPDNLKQVIANFKQILVKDGVFIVSVPLETGIPLLLKQIIRRVAAWRSLGHYEFAERYSWNELVKMVCARDDTVIDRKIREFTLNGKTYQIYGHKGFNWKSLKILLENNFQIEEINFTPLGFGGPLINSQVWFVCRL